ncbi:hypothetical protein [Spirillospora sp. NPDC029432]|uniref:hypothetical protein n=1 Tax=Spirillospora sp. NPDC029432 TaxID=3154599 RepID=UPI0034551AD1
MATVFRPRHETRPLPAETPEEILGHACTLLRLCGQDAAIAVALLAVVAAGVLTRMPAGVLPLLLLVPVAGPFAMAAGYVVRARRTMVSALAAVRAGTGAPLDPTVPWTPAGLAAGPAPGVRDVELRRLLGAAYRCCDLSWHAVVWAVGTSAAFVLWTTVMTAAG